MAGSDKNLVLQLLITAKDEATSIFSKVFGALNDATNVIAGKIRSAFTGLFGGALDGAVEFEAQLDKVQAKGQLTDTAMAELRQTAIDMGAKFGVSGTQAAQGMESLAAAGLNAKQILQALPSVMALAKVEGLSMDAASEKLANSLTAVGLGFDQAGRMADVLTKAALESTTSASAVAEALATCGQIAGTAGLTFEETAAALTALAQGGIQGEKAGTALQAILTQLLNPASSASLELNKLGITSRELGTVLEQLAAKGAANNAAILAFGETAGPGLRTLLAAGQEGLAGLTAAMLQAGGSAQTTADTMGTNLLTAMGALAAAWAQVKTALLEPVLEPLAKAAQSAADSLQNTLASGALKSTQDAIKTFVVEGIAAVQAFIKDFDFAAAKQAVMDFADGAKSAFESIRSVGETAANVVSLAWNTLAMVFRPIMAALLEVAASAMQTLSNVEAAASKVGLGTQERANELAQTALELHTKAKDLMAGVEANASNAKAAFDRLTEGQKATSASAETLAERQDRLRRALEDANAEVEGARLRLDEANEGYRLAAAGGGDLADAQTLLKIRTQEYQTALEAQEKAQQAATKAIPPAKTAMEQLGDAAKDAAGKVETLDPAAKKAAGSVVEISRGFRDGIPSQKEYTDGLNYLVKGTGDLAQGVTSGKDAQGTYNKALLDGAVATQTAQDKTALLTAEIGRVSQASAAWSSGKQLNITILNSLQNTLESTVEKLKVLEERQRAGEDVDNQIIKTKAEVKQAYDRYQTALEENITQQERAIAAAQRAAQLGQQEADLNVQRAQSALELARIKGDANSIAQAENELLDAQVEKIHAAERGKYQEAAAYEELIAATKRKLEADGELSVSDQAQLAAMADKQASMELEAKALGQSAQALLDKTAAEKQAAEAARETAEAEKQAAAAAAEAAAQRKAAGDFVNSVYGAANKILQETGGEIEQLTEQFNTLQAAYVRNSTSFQDWANASLKAARDVADAYTAQKSALDAAVTALTTFAETGEGVAEAHRLMIRNSGELATQYNLLNEQDLDQLRGALADANDKLKEMQQETQDARSRLAELNAELLEAQGADQKAALLRQQLDYQQQLAEIEAQRATAEAAGNRELLGILAEQERVLRQINDAKIDNIQTDDDAEAAGDRVARAWRGAADAADGMGKALHEVKSAAEGVANTDLSHLGKQLAEMAEKAAKLKDVL